MSCCKRTNLGELPGGLVVRILGFYCHDPGSIPGGGKFLQAVWFDQKKKKQPTNLGFFRWAYACQFSSDPTTPCWLLPSLVTHFYYLLGP